MFRSIVKNYDRDKTVGNFHFQYMFRKLVKKKEIIHNCVSSHSIFILQSLEIIIESLKIKFIKNNKNCPLYNFFLLVK